jgi:hypothetical protein
VRLALAAALAFFLLPAIFAIASTVPSYAPLAQTHARPAAAAAVAKRAATSQPREVAALRAELARLRADADRVASRLAALH